MSTRKSVLEAVKADPEQITWTFTNGQQLTVRLVDLPGNIHQELLLHGLRAKVQDTWSGCKGDVEVASAAAQACLAALTAGDWNRKPSGTTCSDSDLQAALHRASGRSLEDCAAAVARLRDNPTARKAALQVPAVEAALAEIRAERKREAAGTGKVDLQDLL